MSLQETGLKTRRWIQQCFTLCFIIFLHSGELGRPNRTQGVVCINGSASATFISKSLTFIFGGECSRDADVHQAL